MGTFSRVFLAHRYSEWTFGHGRGSCLGGVPRLHLEAGEGAITCKRGRVLGRKGHFSRRVYTWNA